MMKCLHDNIRIQFDDVVFELNLLWSDHRLHVNHNIYIYQWGNPAMLGTIINFNFCTVKKLEL